MYTALADKNLYETLGTIAAKLPESEREQFANLVHMLASDLSLRPLTVIRRWLKDTEHEGYRRD